MAHFYAKRNTEKNYAALGTCRRLFVYPRTVIIQIQVALPMLFQKLKTACLYNACEKSYTSWEKSTFRRKQLKLSAPTVNHHYILGRMLEFFIFIFEH
jgi:hypothetical protein